MRELKEIREDINRVDTQMGTLFDQRMKLSREVAAYKTAHNLPVLDAEREKKVLENHRREFPNRDEEFLDELTRFYQTLMDLSKEEQKKLIHQPVKIGYYGVPGSFTQEAFLTMMGSGTEGVSYGTFKEIFDAIHQGDIRYGVVPLENSLTGIIDDVYDLLGQYHFYIRREKSIRIRQNLMGLPGTKIEQIKEVYSHPQGFSQSMEFLSAYPDWKLIPYHNTARSAELVSTLKDPSKACIAGAQNARLYHLEILKEDIQDNQENFTRFALISPHMETDEEADTISLYFTLKHEPGSLYGMLESFSREHLNLLRIDSRPIKGRIWEYAFFVDIEGNLDDENVIRALKTVEDHCLTFRVLGNFKKP